MKKTLLDILWFVALGILIGQAVAGTLDRHVLTYPPLQPSRDTSIPYCPTHTFGQSQTFYPCMYSSLEKSA